MGQIPKYSPPHGLDFSEVETGAVFDYIPMASDQPTHKTYPDNCWCEPEVWEYMGENGHADFFIIDHHFVH